MKNKSTLLLASGVLAFCTTVGLAENTPAAGWDADSPAQKGGTTGSLSGVSAPVSSATWLPNITLDFGAPAPPAESGKASGAVNEPPAGAMSTPMRRTGADSSDSPVMGPGPRASESPVMDAGPGTGAGSGGMERGL